MSYNNDLPKYLREHYLLKSIITANFKRPASPFKFTYIATYRCNARCIICNIWKKSSYANELDIDDIDKFFKIANKFSWISISGGEPFLRSDLPEISDIITTYCDRLAVLHFATNGFLTDKIMDLSRYIHKKNKNLKIAYTVSVDGPPALHDEIRGIPGTWEKAIATYTQLRDIESVEPRIGYTISPYNVGGFEDAFASIKKIYPKLKFDDININIFQKSGFYYENREMADIDIDKTSAEIKKILKMDRDPLTINNFLRRTYLKLWFEYIKTNKPPLKCQAFSATCILDPYGYLYPCPIYNKKFLNIKDIEEDFSNIWNSNDAKKLGYECSHNMCPSCWSPCDAYNAIIGSLPKALFRIL